MERTVFISLPIEDLQSVIIDCVNSCLKNNKQDNNNPQPEKKKKYYTRKETAALLHISLVTLNDYTNKGKLTSYKFGDRRVLYCCDEVEATLKQVEPLKYRRAQSWEPRTIKLVSVIS